MKSTDLDSIRQNIWGKGKDLPFPFNIGKKKMANAKKEPEPEPTIKEQKPQFKSSFRAWVRVVAFVIIAVFLPEQVAQAVEYDWRTLWQKPTAGTFTPAYLTEKVVLKYEWRSELCRKGIIGCVPKNRFWPEDQDFAPIPKDFKG